MDYSICYPVDSLGPALHRLPVDPRVTQVAVLPQPPEAGHGEPLLDPPARRGRDVHHRGGRGHRRRRRVAEGGRRRWPVEAVQGDCQAA